MDLPCNGTDQEKGAKNDQRDGSIPTQLAGVGRRRVQNLGSRRGWICRGVVGCAAMWRAVVNSAFQQFFQ